MTALVKTLPSLEDQAKLEALPASEGRRFVTVRELVARCVHGSLGAGRLVAVAVGVNVNVFSLGLSNATEEQQVYSAIWSGGRRGGVVCWFGGGGPRSFMVACAHVDGVGL